MNTRSIVLCLLVSASPLMAQAPVPMHEEPRHRLVLTHRHVRVMDVKIPPRDTTLFHIHDVPALYVTVSAAAVDAQRLNSEWGGTRPDADPGRKPGDVSIDTSYVRHPLTHRVTNVGSRLMNLIAITNTTLVPDGSPWPDMPGNLELQNRWFAQSRVHVSAGAGGQWYSVHSPTIIVQPIPGAATVLLNSGEKHVLDTPGAWVLVPAGTRYQLSSLGSATLVVVQVR